MFRIVITEMKKRHMVWNTSLLAYQFAGYERVVAKRSEVVSKYPQFTQGTLI